jgi:prepilin-type N-terminal cleavage/methylation domain-containing protein
MKLRLQKQNQKGFTLIELLVVIGILAILLAITLIAINPNKHFQDTRNTQRSSNVSEILNAIYEYESANNGNEPPSVANVTSSPKPLGAVASQTASGTSFSTPNLTLTGLTGNTITSGTVTLTSCSQSGNDGTWPVVSGNATQVVVNDPGGNASSDTTCSIGSWTGIINLCTDLVPTFIANMPMDPTSAIGTACTGSYDTGYTISSSSGRFTINAPSAEDGATISVTR